MLDIQSRKKEVVHMLGPAIEIIEGAGLDPPRALMVVLKDSEDSDFFRLEAKTSQCLTSELAYLSGSLEDVYGQDFKKRLSMIEFPFNDIERLYLTEKVLSHAGLTYDRRRNWTDRRFFPNNTTMDDLPPREVLTLSELLLITHEANAILDTHQKNGRSVLPVPAQLAARVAATIQQKGQGVYAKLFDERVKLLGWTDQQTEAFINIEYPMIATNHYK